MLLPLNLTNAGAMTWPGVTSGVEVVRASNQYAEVVVTPRTCGHAWHDPLALTLGEGWRGLPSGGLKLEWQAQPGESLTLALTQQRGHPTGCWVESFLIAQRWLPDNIAGPDDEPPPPDVGDPMCPAGSFWAVRFEGITLCTCVKDLDVSKSLSGPVLPDWICMKEGIEYDTSIPPNSSPPVTGWPVVESFAGDVCAGDPIGTATLAVELWAFGGKVGVLLYESPAGSPASVFASTLHDEPGIGSDVTLPNTNTSCVEGPSPVIGHGGSAIVRKLK